MSRNAKADFYWKDWRSDDCLRLCGFAAQGLWMFLLCYAAEADEVGFVVFQGMKMDAELISKLSGKSVEEIEELLAELERNFVFSVDHRGIMYSRRMVRDAKKRITNTENGKKGGNPNIRKQRGKSQSDNRSDKPHAEMQPTGHPTDGLTSQHNRPPTPTIPLNHLTTSPQQPLKPPERAVDKVCEAIGVKLTDDARRMNWPADVGRMLDDGLDLERDILPACRKARERNIANMLWVRRCAETLKADRSIATEQANAPSPFEDADDEGWRKRIEVHKRKVSEGISPEKCWPSKWGNLPGHDPRHPQKVLAEFGFIQAEPSPAP